MDNSVECTSYNCVLFSPCFFPGDFFPCSFKRKATGVEVTFHNSIIGNFMINKIYLKQIYCTAIHAPTTFTMVFYTFFYYFWSQHCLLNRNKYIGETFFVFDKFAFPSTLLLIPSPTAATCALSNSTYKLSISTDMVVEIQVKNF